MQIVRRTEVALINTYNDFAPLQETGSPGAFRAKMDFRLDFGYTLRSIAFPNGDMEMPKSYE